MLKILRENMVWIFRNSLSLFRDNIVILTFFLVIFLVMDYVFGNFNISLSSFIFIFDNINILSFLMIVLMIFMLSLITGYIVSLYKSDRLDICLTYIFILALIFDKNLILSKYILVYITVIFLYSLIKSIIRIYKWVNVGESILIKDKPLSKDDNDLLGFEDKAKDFSEILYNNGSKDNQVFGLVAEWGAGKTSFLNKLQETELISKKCIYIEFNPWYYENEKELLKSFLDNIISHLKGENYYLPTLSKTFKNFIKLLEKNSSSLFGLDLNFFSDETLENLKDRINLSLESIDKKIIIVIDDMDRISSNKLKEIFRIVDLCRGFHNTNYILCYDPLNFNSIDTNLVETLRQNNGETLHIDSESVDNKELVKYMAKIINVYYPLVIDKLKLKEYFIKLFTEGRYVNFSKNSKLGIKSGIEILFSIEDYNLWGKYYGNIRGIKRILNNLVSIGKTNQSDFIYDLFDINSNGLEFDKLVKLSLLKLYYNHLYRDIEDEYSIYGVSDNAYLSKNKYSLGYFISQNKENIDYTNYLEQLKNEERKLITNIIPILNTNDVPKIRLGSKLKSYIDIEQTSSEAGYNRYMLNKVLEYKDNTKNLEMIFKEIKDKYRLDGLKKFISDFKEEISNWEERDNFKKRKALEFIDFIINYDDFYKSEDDFSFYINIAKILDSSVNQNNSPENCAYIGEYFYGEGDYNNEKPLYIKFLDKGDTLDAGGKILGLREALRLLFSLDKSRRGDFFNFWTGVGDISKLYSGIFSEFKKRYIDENINIFEYVYKWEASVGKDKRSMISHLTYMLAHYSSDEASKKVLSDYFIKCFDRNIEFFLKFLESFVQDNDSFARRTGDDYFIDINSFYENFIKEDVIEFVNNKKVEIVQIANKRLSLPSIYQGGEDIETNQKELFEKFLKRI